MHEYSRGEGEEDQCEEDDLHVHEREGRVVHLQGLIGAWHFSVARRHRNRRA